MRLTWDAVMIVACAMAGCQTSPVEQANAPRACNRAAFANAAALPLPPATPLAEAQTDKSAPLRFANAIPINGGIGDIGDWSAAAPGWDAWRLRLTSDGAKSLSVHLQPLDLPAAAELWLCSPDGKVRHGPYRGAGPSGNGEFWSPLVPGPELWAEVIAPAARTSEVRLKIVAAFAGFR